MTSLIEFLRVPKTLCFYSVVVVNAFGCLFGSLMKTRHRAPIAMAERPIQLRVALQPILPRRMTLRGQSPAPGKILEASTELAKGNLFLENNPCASANLAGSNADWNTPTISLATAIPQTEETTEPVRNVLNPQPIHATPSIVLRLYLSTAPPANSPAMDKLREKAKPEIIP